MFGRKKEDIEGLLPDEPAKKHYFLDKGFSDLGATIRESFELNGATAKKHSAAIGSYSGGTAGKIFNGILRICAIVAMYIFGTILTLVISFFHSLVIAIIMLGVYICLGVSRLVDNLYIGLRRIAVVCDKCKVRSELPGYKCPVCGQIHYRLRPNVFGIFTHKCLCGQRLPALFFLTTKNESTGDKYRRKKLESVCANPNCSSQVFSEESRPLCIPIAGSRSVGKTAFLTAVSHELIESRLPSNGCTVTHYNSEKETMYSSIVSDYSRGETSMTIESANQRVPSAFSLSFFVEHKTLRPRRLVHVFDIAGETFVRNAEHERQLHYSYADGVILIVDPMAIPDVSDQFEDRLNDVDTKSIGREDLDSVLSSLVTKMQNANVLASGQKIDVPLAVVINKIDEPGISDFFTDSARDVYKASKQKCTDQEAEDALCRAFLRNNGMGNFVNTVEVNFKKVQYFACSAIGHSRGDGPYSPQGVLNPVIWIASTTDKPLLKLISSEGSHQNSGGEGE